ncbi:MAG: hypothetical protein IT210_04485 [Armatimonadetes bacterium]|nr:hypothetical protein [Armatimonadota bacterium]
MKIEVRKQSLRIEAQHFTARMEGAALVSLKDRETGAEFCREAAHIFPLELTYAQKDALGQDKHQEVSTRALSDIAARVVLEGNDSDRELLLRLDPSTGDLCVQPSGQSARRGVLSIRWNVPFAAESALVLPCVNGIKVEAARPFPGSDRFPWPYRWNAQLAIVEREGCSLMVYSQDIAARFKALNLRREEGKTALGFESEQVGPVWDNRTAGGVEWRLNTFEGDWRKAAARYRDWMQESYRLGSKRAFRPEWVENIAFSVGWADARPELLDALAKLHAPSETLIHLSNWRNSAYDVDYPDYTPSREAIAYLKKANEMGFKVMPHFNYFACYWKHPLYARVRDWQIRDAARNEPQGWYWPPETHDYTRMAYIHPGLALWRRTLGDAVREACALLQAPAAFIDQTLCTWNTDNGLVENMTTVEGMRQLQEEFTGIQPGMVLAGEGLNEISFQRECFAQAHIHDGWGNLKPHHIEAAHPILFIPLGRPYPAGRLLPPHSFRQGCGHRHRSLPPHGGRPRSHLQRPVPDDPRQSCRPEAARTGQITPMSL